MFNAILAGLFLTRGRFGMIYASSPPLFVGGAALVLSILKRLPLAFEVRDLWPKSAVVFGEITNQKAIAWATRLEEAIYRRAKAIIVVTHGIYNRLCERNIPENKMALIPNGANVEMFRFDSENRDRIRADLGIQDKFVAIYAGIHGIAQGLEMIVEAAHLLQDHPGTELMDTSINLTRSSAAIS